MHVGSLALQTENVVWKTDPASHPTIQYGNNRVVVDDIKLVNADQRIEAQGAIGSGERHAARQGRQRRCRAARRADARRPAALAGRLNANATVSGTTAAPRVAGDFTLTQGAFRNFKFMSFGGKVDYAGSGHEPRRAPRPGPAVVADRQGICADNAVPADAARDGRRARGAAARRSDQHRGREQPDRSRRRSGVHVVRDQRHRYAAGELQGHGLRLRPTPRRRDRHQGRRLRGARSRHVLLRDSTRASTSSRTRSRSASSGFSTRTRSR